MTDTKEVFRTWRWVEDENSYEDEKIRKLWKMLTQGIKSRTASTHKISCAKYI